MPLSPAVWIFATACSMGYQTTSSTNYRESKICNVGRFDHITPSLYRLHWLPINYRIEFKILLFVYKALNGIAPSYISDLLELKPASRYNLRSSIDMLLLKHSNFKSLSTLGDRSFKCAGPKLWNELPKDIYVMPLLYKFLNVSSRHIYLKKHSM